MLEEVKAEVTTHSPHSHHAQQTIQPSVEMFCIQKTPHCPVTIVLNSWGISLQLKHHMNIHLIEAHNFTKCVNVLRKPTAYI